MIGSLMAKRSTRAAYEALNRHDLDTFLKDWDEEVTFVYPGDISVSVTHKGKAAVREWFQTFMDKFPTIEFKAKNVAVTNLFDMVGTNVIITEWDIRLTNKDGFSADNSGTTVTRSRKGKAVHVKDTLFKTGYILHKAWGRNPDSGGEEWPSKSTGAGHGITSFTR